MSNKAWRDKNRDKINAYQAAYVKRNKEKLTQQSREYVIAHKEERALKEKARNRKTKVLVLTYYGGHPPKCACCGESEFIFLCIDHINGGGNKFRKENKLLKGYSWYNWLVKNNYPDGYRVLCWNCNSAFGILGYCPHHKPDKEYTSTE